MHLTVNICSWIPFTLHARHQRSQKQQQRKIVWMKCTKQIITIAIIKLWEKKERERERKKTFQQIHIKMLIKNVVILCMS